MVVDLRHERAQPLPIRGVKSFQHDFGVVDHAAGLIGRAVGFVTSQVVSKRPSRPFEWDQKENSRFAPGAHGLHDAVSVPGYAAASSGRDYP